MKLLVLPLFLFTITVVIEARIIQRRRGPPLEDITYKMSTKIPLWNTIIQRVDHFNPTDLRTWEMRYLSNDEHFENGGPIFIYLGGEWEIVNVTLMGGQIYDMAQEHKGYMFYTEHRYYGKSHPMENRSTENLRYLSVDQALADVVYFVEWIKENIDGLRNSKVVAVGASYSASMATWIRLKYPHVVDAAYASSGPVRAVADFYEYYEVVNYNIGLVSEQCLQTISEGMSQLEAKLETEVGIEELSKSLQTCKKIQNVEPYKSHLFNVVIAEIFAALVQLASPTSIQTHCQLIDSYSGTALNKLVSYIRWNYGIDCIDDYDKFIKDNSAIEHTDKYARLWWYQTCTEYGYYQTTTSSNQPFGDTFGLDFFLNICTDLFGENFGIDILNTGIKRTNSFYGSLMPEITKVVTVHGTVDPWHALGILEDLNPLAPSIVVTGSSHCADLSSIRDSDSDEMFAAKTRVKELIAQWIR